MSQNDSGAGDEVTTTVMLYLSLYDIVDETQVVHLAYARYTVSPYSQGLTTYTAYDISYQ